MMNDNTVNVGPTTITNNGNYTITNDDYFDAYSNITVNVENDFGIIKFTSNGTFKASDFGETAWKTVFVDFKNNIPKLIEGSRFNTDEYYNPYVLSLFDNAFENCNDIITINLPNCTYIGTDCFLKCENLQSVSLPKCVEIGNHSFENCVNLTSISLPLCSDIGWDAFNGCNNLRSISIPLCESVGISAFNSCYNLETITLPKCSYIDLHAFDNCYKLVSLYLPNNSVCSIRNENVFNLTPITGYVDKANGQYGSVYVPEWLLNDYINDANWRKHAVRFVPYIP